MGAANSELFSLGQGCGFSASGQHTRARVSCEAKYGLKAKLVQKDVFYSCQYNSRATGGIVYGRVGSAVNLLCPRYYYSAPANRDYTYCRRW